MEVEQALDFVSPRGGIVHIGEEGLGAEKGVNDKLTWLAGFGGLQGRVEFPQNVCDIVRFSNPPFSGVENQVESWSSSEIESGQVVPCTHDSAYTDVRAVNSPEAIKQGLGRAWSSGSVGVALARSNFLTLGDQLEPGVFWERVEFDPTIGMPC